MWKVEKERKKERKKEDSKRPEAIYWYYSQNHKDENNNNYINWKTDKRISYEKPMIISNEMMNTA